MMCCPLLLHWVHLPPHAGWVMCCLPPLVLRQDDVNGRGSSSRTATQSSSQEEPRSSGADKENRHDSKKRRSRSRGRSRSRSRGRHGSRRHSGDRDHGRSRRSRSRSRERRHRRSRSRSRDRRRPPPPPRGRSRSRSKERHRRRSPSPKKRPMLEETTPEERDMRTVFCMQLSQRIRARDLEEFFSSVGKVRDVRMIMDNKTRRSKGIAYVEFQDVDSVPLAMGLSGQKLYGVPIIVQPTQAERNRAAANATTLQRGTVGPMRLYVGSLHFNITEEMLRGIFEPFGKIDKIELIRDMETNRSKGYGFITFHDAEDAKKALEQLNGFELAGRPMKVGHVTERTDASQAPSFLDSEELDRSGIDLGATGRLQLMAKLAEGTGFQIPQAAVNALQMNPLGLPGQPQATPTIATQCFMLSNMFDPFTETNPTWDEEIRNDVVEECRKHGGALHVYVDKASPEGHVYVKCPTISSAVASVNALHGRWFAGRIITAAYVPVLSYHGLFPDSATATALM
ncbi:RNA-binding protein 39-like isoform X2 [Ornithodoros turicata]|uniref:RNA-binding protein 39-like isoform X2 n=1 Tax=Ornithodoros turicata TaxID=34597 RepID=UPI00313964C2